MAYQKGQALLERWFSFMNGLKKEDRIAIVYDSDPDGVASAVILAKAIERLRGKKIDLALHMKRDSYGVDRRLLRLVRKQEITHVFTVDVAFDEQPDSLNVLTHHTEVVVIDHHSLHNELQSAHLLILKPQLLWNDKDPATYASSKLVYDLVQKIVDVSDLSWIACIGIIGDCAGDRWRRFLGSVFKRYDVRYRKDLFDTTIGRVSTLISNAGSYDIRMLDDCFSVLYHARLPQDVFVPKLCTVDRLVGCEIEKYLRRFGRLPHKEDTLLYEIKPRHFIKAALSTLVGQRFKNKTVIIADVRGKVVTVSARRNDRKFSMCDLMEKSMKGISGASGGGHVPAAAARLPRENYPLFKKRLLSFLL